MTSISYDEILRGMMASVEAYDFLTLSDEAIDDFLCSWIHRSLSLPTVRRLFEKLEIDDENRTFSFTMNTPLDDSSDADFVKTVVTDGVIIEWITPKILSITALVNRVGSKDEKWYSQSAHLNELRTLRSTLRQNQNKLIGERGFMYNPYLQRES